MKSRLSILIIISFTIFFRLSFSPINDKKINVLTYDAFGYYIYLPSIFIYDDYKELKWIDKIDDQYKVTGGKLYQANKEKNENYVFKYFCGVSILQAPFFAMANSTAEKLGFPPDGFSMPYQIAIVFSSIFYFILGLIFLRKTLLSYFTDPIVSLIILSITIATNLIQYVGIDCGMTHSYLFFIYCIIIYLTNQVHKSPSKLNTFILGLFCGLAIITRPTEAICILIPILWRPSFDLMGKTKFEFIKSNLQFLIFPLIAGTAMILIQITYWKISSGSFIYDVGSKWVFLNPFFRVLFGFEKGWFVYTPISIFFIWGLFKMKDWPFNKSVLIFSILNIWIIISWFDWRYGGCYSARALSHSYPVFALGLGSLLQSLKQNNFINIFKVGLAAFIFLNVFQLFQYNNGILHFNDMNRKYYGQIFLNPDPEPKDFSLLDTDDWIKNKDIHQSNLIFKSKNIDLTEHDSNFKVDLNEISKGIYLGTKINLSTKSNFWSGKLEVEIKSASESIKKQSFRLDRPLASPYLLNIYEFYTLVPKDCFGCTLTYSIKDSKDLNSTIGFIEVNKISPK